MLHNLSAVELNKKYSDKEISPVEVAKYLIARIEQTHEELNAFCFFEPKDIMQYAIKSEKRWMSGEPVSLIDGVPISIKDLLYLKGWPTLHGSSSVRLNQSWDFDSPSVARLREKGAVFLGKTSTPEFGHKGVTESLLFGKTNNPWNTGMTPGGSSGGAASALAAGLGPLALGTDGGGSCRKPANYCGVIGMKPSQGKVPAWPSSHLWPLSSAGPMARTVEDLALLLDIISENDYRDPSKFLFRSSSFNDLDDGIKNIKIGFSLNLGGSFPRKEIADIIKKSVGDFVSGGAHIFDASPSGFDEAMSIYRTILDSGMALTGSFMTENQKRQCDPTFFSVVERGMKISALELRQAFDKRYLLIRNISLFFENYDLFILPTNPTTAYPHGTREPVSEPEDRWNTTVCFTAPFNITGNPAISIPCGKTQKGLPVGLQIVGPFGYDSLVLRAAKYFEKVSNLKGQLAENYINQ